MPTKQKTTSLPQKPAAFIEPMECLAVTKLPDFAKWVWEIKIDGYRAIAVKTDHVNLYSRTRNSFNSKFSYIVEALWDMPQGTVLDGEIVAIDDDGRPNFNSLQNFRTGASHIQYYVFDLLCLNNRDTTRLPLIERRNLLKTLSFKDKRIKILDYIEAEPSELVRAVREQKLEGIVGKRKDGVVPLTLEQHSRLYETWLAGGPTIVEQIRQQIDQHLESRPSRTGVEHERRKRNRSARPGNAVTARLRGLK
jgi:ATP-dependent DNA ligase